MLTVALAVLALAADPHPKAIAGEYRIARMEAGGGLLLQPDGKFYYGLDYGAVSEVGEGVWSSDGRTVRLTSKPMPRAPRFVVTADAPAPKNVLTVRMSPALPSGYSLYLLMLKAGQRPIQARVDDDGSVDIRDIGMPDTIIPSLPTVPPGAPIRLSQDRGHQLTIRFEPNDLGKAAFDGTILPVTKDGLVLQRWDTEFPLRKVSRKTSDGPNR